jgi:hypothetical protein
MKPSSIQRVVKNLSILRVFQKMTETKKYLPKAGAIGERLHSTKCFCTWTHVKKHHDNKLKINLF